MNDQIMLGIYKELKGGEELISEGKEIIPLTFAREVHKKILGLLSRTEEELTGRAYAKVYLTNQRLLFLNLYVMQAEQLPKKEAELKKAKLSISGFAGEWFELPISAIGDTQLTKRGVELYYKTSSKIRHVSKGLSDLLGISSIEGREEKIIMEADNAGMWKMQIDNLRSKD